MQIQWHGRDGKGGQDKSLITIPIEPASERQAGRNLVLKAGINGDVPDADWELARENRIVQLYLENGCLEEIHVETLRDFPENKAVKMPKETIDMNLLGKWRRAELESSKPRPKVIEAIDKQIEAMITIPTPPAAQPPNDHNAKPPSAGGAPVSSTAPVPRTAVSQPAQPWTAPRNNEE